MNEETVALLPCPFCGGEAEFDSPISDYRVSCQNSGCETAGPWPRNCTEAEAITAWNTRAAAMGWLDIASAKKDRTVIWAALHPRIYPDLEPERPDLEPWNGVQVPLRHNGVADDGFDIGWQIAAQVGMGGFPDHWIIGWQPLPTPPEQST